MLEPIQPKSDIWQNNPKLKGLLLVLIFVFLFSGIALVIFSVWSNQYRQKIYEETESLLPKRDAGVVIPNETKIIGGDKDEGGCLVGAGYSWCEAKNKCLRVWEEKCE